MISNTYVCMSMYVCGKYLCLKYNTFVNAVPKWGRITERYLLFIPKCKDGIEAKQHAIHYGQRCLDQRQIPCACAKGELPGLDYEDPAGHEQGAAQHAKEDVDALVYGCTHQDACETKPADIHSLYYICIYMWIVSYLQTHR